MDLPPAPLFKKLDESVIEEKYARPGGRLGRSPIVQSQRKEFVHCVHEYLNFKGTKLSKSRGAFVEVPYFLERYDPDALRFYPTATAPETCDTEPVLRAPKDLWEDLVERNNPVLSVVRQCRPGRRVNCRPEAAAAKQLPSGRCASALDESVIEEEHARLEGCSASNGSACAIVCECMGVDKSRASAQSTAI